MGVHPFNPGLGRQRQVDLCVLSQPGLQTGGARQKIRRRYGGTSLQSQDSAYFSIDVIKLYDLGSLERTHLGPES